jgi:hypothetical protein
VLAPGGIPAGKTGALDQSVVCGLAVYRSNGYSITWLMTPWIAARSASVSSMNTRGMQIAIRVSNRNTPAIPAGTAPSQDCGASRYSPGSVPYMAPSRMNESVRWSTPWYTQNRPPKSGTCTTDGPRWPSMTPSPYTTSWFGQATSLSSGTT